MNSASFYIAQLLGIVAGIMLCSSYLAKSKKKFLVLSIIGDIVYGLSYVFVNSLGTGIITILSCSQSFVSYLFERKEKRMPVWICVLYSFAFIAIGILTMESYWDIIPVVVYVWYCFALYVEDINTIRLMYFVPLVMLSIYDITVKAYATALEDGFEATFLAVVLIINFIKSHKLRYEIKRRATLNKTYSSLSWLIRDEILQSTTNQGETSDNFMSSDMLTVLDSRSILRKQNPIPPY